MNSRPPESASQIFADRAKRPRCSTNVPILVLGSLEREYNILRLRRDNDRRGRRRRGAAKDSLHFIARSQRPDVIAAERQACELSPAVRVSSERKVLRCSEARDNGRRKEGAVHSQDKRDVGNRIVLR